MKCPRTFLNRILICFGILPVSTSRVGRNLHMTGFDFSYLSRFHCLRLVQYKGRQVKECPHVCAWGAPSRGHYTFREESLLPVKEHIIHVFCFPTYSKQRLTLAQWSNYKCISPVMDLVPTLCLDSSALPERSRYNNSYFHQDLIFISVNY